MAIIAEQLADFVICALYRLRGTQFASDMNQRLARHNDPLWAAGEPKMFHHIRDNQNVIRIIFDARLLHSDRRDFGSEAS